MTQAYPFRSQLLCLSTIIFLLFCGSTRAQTPAFPGAEGYAKYITGGRGGVVYEVTNTDDDVLVPPPGSLRFALTDTATRLPRTIVFRVSGIITLKGRLDVGKNGINNITIAGQTAPGDGICLRKYPLKVYGTNCIIRYLRSRPGDETHSNSPAIYGIDVENAKDILVDHCSFSWSIEEAATFYDNKNTTMQWCIISESLNSSTNVKGDHGYAGVWGGQYASYHHNLIAHHHSRTPRFNGARSHDTTAVIEYRNNVIYNWGNSDATYGGEVEIAKGVSHVTMSANYYKPGPATPIGTKRYRIIEPTDTTVNPTKLSKWFIDRNYMDGNAAVTADNWNGGVQPKPAGLWPVATYRSDTEFTQATYTPQSALDAYGSVLASAGATLPRRDSIDMRIVKETSSGTAAYGAASLATPGLYGPGKGIINTPSDVGGWPSYASLPAPPDTDHDGMPDVWELAHGLNPNGPSDRNTIGTEGYTMLESYLNGITGGDATGVETEKHMPAAFALLQNYPNPFNPSTTLEFTVPEAGYATLVVSDILGREAAVVFAGELAQGAVVKRVFDGKRFSSGVYIARLKFGNSVIVKKLLLAK
jgi:hypothetical protein